MWATYSFISYLILALLVPTIWALWPTWRRSADHPAGPLPGFWQARSGHAGPLVRRAHARSRKQ
jgi:hypothetical protein